MIVRALTEADADAYQALRLRSLRESPRAFGSSYEEEVNQPLGPIAERLARGAAGEDVIFGAWDDEGALVGMAGLGRQRTRKSRHRGGVWGMYVAPEARGRGVGRALLDALIAHARTVEGLHRLELGVEATNTAARELYLRAGFIPYGIHPDAYRMEGTSWDSVLMTMDLEETREADSGT